MSKDTIILEDNGQEVLMMGDYVGVCWNVRKVEKSIKHEDGATYKAYKWERYPDMFPYIDFLDIKKDGKGFFANDDSPFEGGLELEIAKKILSELSRAVKYLEKEGNKMRTCEFGDCINYPVTTMRLSEHEIAICSEHKIQAYEMVIAFGRELDEKRTAIILKFFKSVRKGGK